MRTYVVRDRAEFDVARTLVDAQNCVVQEYIDGDEYTCGTINLDGACRGVIAMRRSLRDGDTYKAIVVRDATIETRVAEIANQLGPFGPCNFQLRLKGGEPWVFEINARCSGTCATPRRATASGRRVEGGPPSTSIDPASTGRRPDTVSNVVVAGSLNSRR